jgi:hypothetical protein
MMFERHSFKWTGILQSLRKILQCGFFQNCAIKNNETYKEYRITEATKRVTKNCYKSKEKQVGMANINLIEICQMSSPHKI